MMRGVPELVPPKHMMLALEGKKGFDWGFYRAE
jgi:hypothetical protein